MPSSVEGCISIALCVALWFSWTFGWIPSTAKRTPPGPEGYWLIGNISLLPMLDKGKIFAELGKKYGNIIYMRIYGRPFIVLNSYELASELLDKRGAIYSDRPRSVFIAELVKLTSVTFLPYGKAWRKRRRVIGQFFNSRASKAFQPDQEVEVHIMLKNIRNDPDNVLKYVKRFTMSSIMRITYGHPISGEDDIYLNDINHASGLLFRPGPPGFTKVDLLPFLRHIPSFLPGGRYRRLGTQGYRAIKLMMDKPFEMVQQRANSGKHVPSLMLQLLSSDFGLGDEHLTVARDIGGSLHRAGAVTTEAVINSFVLSMVLHPRIARKAQEEIDFVVSSDRLPTYDDRGSLPYLECILKECLRWSPPFPLGIAHRAMKSDEINGMLVPKGTLLLPNIWLMMHDERNYANPDVFEPERFMNSSEGELKLLDPASVVFGFGRRVCPGRFVAEASIWLTMACMLSVFDIQPAFDSEGCASEINTEGKSTTGSTRKPKSFECRAIPRADGVRGSLLNDM